MNTEQIRQNLESETERLSAIRTDLRESHSLDSEGNDQELSSVDQHPADSGTEQAQREIDLSLLEQVEAELSDVERAMKKLDDGTYGQCEVDGEAIEPARLEALPAARFCEKHAQ